MRLWPKSKKVAELERQLKYEKVRCDSLNSSVERLLEQLELVQYHRNKWRDKHARLSKAHMKLQKAHRVRGQKINDLKGIINQMKEQQRGKSDSGN